MPLHTEPLTEKVDRIVDFGERYIKEYLNAQYLFRQYEIERENLQSDWSNAFKFFLSRIVYQGRRDELSTKVYRTALAELTGYLRSPRALKLRLDRKRQLQKRLKRRIGKGKVGKNRDVSMIIDALDFVSNIKDGNIVNYSLGMISKGAVQGLYQELDRIRSVGPKTASLFLRDLVFLFGLEDKIQDEIEVLVCFQPIDTWVRKIVVEDLKTVQESRLSKPTDDEVRRDICGRLRRKSLRFNAGAWYVGRNSLNILVKNLEKIEPRRGCETHRSSPYFQGSICGR